MIALTASSVRAFYGARFFYLASIPTFLGMGATVWMVGPPASLVAIVAMFVHGAMLVERASSPQGWSEEQTRRRFAVLVVLGMAVISCDLFVLRADYMLFLPVLTGILYLNVNVILRREWLRRAILVFMATPLVALFWWSSPHAATLVGVLILMALVTWASNGLHQVNASVLRDSERELELLRTVSRLSNALVEHDVRNELQKMQILATSRFRSDPVLFLDAFADFAGNIQTLLDGRPFESRQTVLPRELIDRLAPVLSDPDIEFQADWSREAVVEVNRNLLFSTLKNLLDNAVEASRRLGRRAKVRLVQDRDVLVLEDDCGGFPLDQIAKGHSSKEGEGHGVFLKTLLDPIAESIFGFRAEIQNTGKGTRVVLRFSAVA